MVTGYIIVVDLHQLFIVSLYNWLIGV